MGDETMSSDFSEDFSHGSSKQCFELGFNENQEEDKDFTASIDIHSEDITEKMSSHLPTYIINCFLAAGFDSLDVITDMNLSNKPGYSIETIENYINEQFPGDKTYTHFGSNVCKFPPGHKGRINKFVQVIKNEVKKRKEM